MNPNSLTQSRTGVDDSDSSESDDAKP